MRPEPPLFSPFAKRVFRRITFAFLLTMPVLLLVLLAALNSWLMVLACFLPGVVTILLVYPLIRSHTEDLRRR